MPRKKSEPNPAFVACVDIWLKDVHPGWTFNGTSGAKIKSIIKKVEHLCKANGHEPTLDRITNSFKWVCVNLPDWYKDKDLSIIDAHFNTIITQILQGKQNGKANWSNKTSTQRIIDSL